MRRSQAQAIRPAGARSPAVARKAPAVQRQAPAGNHARAGPAPDHAPAPRASPDAGRDVASIVQQARTAPRAHIIHAGAAARDFGLPLSALEIRAGGAAEAMCRLLGARAFAVQNLVVFADPRPSLALVRHELAHVVQQDGASRPAPGQYQPGSLALGAAGSAVEREAAAAAAGDTDAPTRGAPIAVQRNEVDEQPAEASDDNRPARQRAEERLRHLAEEIELKTFEGAKDALFGITKVVQGDQPTAETDEAEFDPAFLLSSATTWTVEKYMEVNQFGNVATEKRRARYEVSDLIFKRAPNGALKDTAIASTGFIANNKYMPGAGVGLWAARAIPEDLAVSAAATRDTTFYAFLGTYTSAAAGSKIAGSPNLYAMVNERGRYERGEADPAKSIDAYLEIIKAIRKLFADSKKKDALLEGLDELEAAIAKHKTGTAKITKANARDGRRDLAKWVLLRFTGIDEFFTLIQAKGFPESWWNPIKGDIQTSFIAELAKTAGVAAEARQVWFGERTATKLLTRIEPLEKIRRGDGFIKVADGYHILESKARISAPSADEIAQMVDYREIVTKRLPGYLVENGKILPWPEGERKFSAVEYYLGMSTIPAPGEEAYTLASSWTVELFKAFGGSAKDAEKLLTTKVVHPKGYLIHPNLTGDPAKFTTIQINPPITLPIPTPDQVDQTLTDVPSKQPGAKIRAAQFKLAHPREAEIASGTVTIGLDLAGAVKSPEEAKPMPILPVSREEAKPLSAAGRSSTAGPTTSSTISRARSTASSAIASPQT